MPAPAPPDLREVCAFLRKRERQWRALGIVRVRVFGSVAREEAGAESDVDVLVDYGHDAGLLELMQARERFEDWLGYRTDVVTLGALEAPLRGEVLADAVDVMHPQRRGTRAGQKRWRWRMAQLVELCDRCRTLTEGLDPAALEADRTRREALLLCLLRLGEGTKFVPQSLQDRNPQVPWAGLRDLRNLIAHNYFGIDPALLLQTARRELPPVRAALAELLAGADHPQPPEHRRVRRG